MEACNQLGLPGRPRVSPVRYTFTCNTGNMVLYGLPSRSPWQCGNASSIDNLSLLRLCSYTYYLWRLFYVNIQSLVIEVEKYTQQHLPQYIEELRALCAIDSDSYNKPGLDEMARWLGERMRGLGMDVSIIARELWGDDLLGVMRGTGQGDIVSVRKGNTAYMLTARGRSAHAGVEPEKGRNAIVELAHQVLQFQALNGWREGITISAGVVSGGTAPNVVPEFAQVEFDLRFLSHEDRIATEQRFRELMAQKYIPDVELTLEGAPDSKGPMVRTPESLQLVERAQEIAHMLAFPSITY